MLFKPFTLFFMTVVALGVVGFSVAMLSLFAVNLSRNPPVLDDSLAGAASSLPVPLTPCARPLAYIEFDCTTTSPAPTFALISYSCCDTNDDGLCTTDDQAYHTSRAAFPESISLAGPLTFIVDA